MENAGVDARGLLDRHPIETTTVGRNSTAAVQDTAVDCKIGEGTEAQQRRTLAVVAGRTQLVDSLAVADGEQEASGNFDLVAEFVMILPNFQLRKPDDWKCDCCLLADCQAGARECPFRSHEPFRT